VQLSGLRYRYPGASGFQLGPLDLEGPDDRPWLLLGPSGSGKSTLLRLLGGGLRPDSGGIRTDLDAASRAYLPQFPERALAGRNLAEDLTGRRDPNPADRARLERAMERMGLAGVDPASRSSGLSAGGRRLAALCLLSLSSFRGWALDEPDAALDRSATDRLIRLLRALVAGEGNRLWVATSRFERFASLDPWVLVLAQGQAEAAGDLRPVLGSSRVQDLLEVPGRPEGRLWTELARRDPATFSGGVLDGGEGSRGRGIRRELARKMGIS